MDGEVNMGGKRGRRLGEKGMGYAVNVSTCWVARRAGAMNLGVPGGGVMGEAGMGGYGWVGRVGGHGGCGAGDAGSWGSGCAGEAPGG